MSKNTIDPLNFLLSFRMVTLTLLTQISLLQAVIVHTKNQFRTNSKNLNTSPLQSHASSLDIFPSNNANLCSEMLEEISFSDHKYFLAEISIEFAEQEALPKMKRFIFGKANWDEFTINCNFPLSSIDSIDYIVDSFLP